MMGNDDKTKSQLAEDVIEFIKAYGREHQKARSDFLVKEIAHKFNVVVEQKIVKEIKEDLKSGDVVGKTTKSALIAAFEKVTELSEKRQKSVVNRTASKEPRKKSFLFVPRYITAPEENKIYVVPDLGLAKCNGIKRQCGDGYSLDVYEFESLIPNTTNSKQSFPLNKIESLQIRLPATKQEMSDLLDTLKAGVAFNPLPSKKKTPINDRYFAAWSVLVNKGNLSSMANVLCGVYGASRTESKPRGNTEIYYADKVIMLLAAEYAHVSGGGIKMPYL